MSYKFIYKCILIEYNLYMSKTIVKTIRFSKEEEKRVQQYLALNPSFESISSLGRVAVMQFIEENGSLLLKPLGSSKVAKNRPGFLWDYDLSERQIRDLLHHAPMTQKSWLIARILDRLSPPAVFDYLSVQDIAQALPALRMNPKVKKHWQEAIEAWM